MSNIRDVFAKARAKDEQPECEGCGSTNMLVDVRQGHLVCADCGIIGEQNMVSRNSEYRNFNESDKPTGDPTRVSGGPLGTKMAALPGQTGIKGHVTASTSERFRVAFRQIGDIVTKMALSHEVREQAQELYAAYAEANSKVTDVQMMAAACVIQASRICRMERTLKEVNMVVAPDKNLRKRIGKALRLLTRYLQELDQKEALKQGRDINDLSAYAAADTTGIVNQNHPAYHVGRFGSDLGLHQRGVAVAKKLANAIKPEDPEGNYEHMPWHGYQPMTLTAATLFIATLLGKRTMNTAVGQRTMQDVADICGVAVGTVESTYAELHPYLRSFLAPLSNLRPPMDEETWKGFPEPKVTGKA